MTGVTPGWGLPYPEQSTLITDSAAIVQELAEKIDAALSAVTASDEYTVPGTLLQEFTTVGIFRPSAGITSVHVVVIGGGGNGGQVGQAECGGGGGGQVVVGRNVPVSGPVEIIIGGQESPTSFGSLSALPGGRGNGWAPGISPNPLGRGNGGTGGDAHTPASAGPTVNGTHYAGGGGGFNYRTQAYLSYGNGGAGGGGRSWRSQNKAADGTAGTGGGGGGGNSAPNNAPGPGLGGSGRVMIYTEQTLLATLELPPATVPKIVAALDDQGTMTGAYAVDAGARELPARLARVVDYPLDPVDTGRTEIALVDPENPTGPTAVVPVLAWPTVGWKYTNNKWEEPKNE